MCDYLALDCTQGTVESDIEKMSDRVSKAEMLVSRVMDNEANTKKLVECILMLGNKDVANKFLTCCASQQTLSASRAVIGQLEGLVDAFGEEVSQFVSSMLTTRHFTSDPAGFCDFVVKTYEALQKKPSNAGLVDRLISSFAEVMCPPVQNDVTLSKSLGANFPLKALLKIVEPRGNCATLTKRIIEGYIWISCQKRQTTSYSYHRSTQTQDPEGPILLTSVSSSIVSLCDKAGWTEMKTVLTSAVEKLCQLGHPHVAINFVGSLLKVAPDDSSAGSNSAERKKLCARLASVGCAKTINHTCFRADPTSTATFFVMCCGILREQDVSKEQALIESFVNVLCPSSRNDFLLQKSIHAFPLSDVLNELLKSNHRQIGIMSKRVVEGYLWLSSQHHSSSVNPWVNRGPFLLASAGTSLKAICEKFGWNAFEVTFSAAVQKLCDKKNYDGAIDLIKAISGPSEGSVGVCTGLATTVVRIQLADQALFRVATTAIQNLKKLMLFICEHCPLLTRTFIERAKTLDVGSILYPFVTDASIRMSASTYVKAAHSKLALVCAQKLQSQITANTGTAAIWSLANAHLSSNTQYSSFLRDPCQKVKDWKGE